MSIERVPHRSPLFIQGNDWWSDCVCVCVHGEIVSVWEGRHSFTVGHVGVGKLSQLKAFQSKVPSNNSHLFEWLAQCSKECPMRQSDSMHVISPSCKLHRGKNLNLCFLNYHINPEESLQKGIFRNRFRIQWLALKWNSATADASLTQSWCENFFPPLFLPRGSVEYEICKLLIMVNFDEGFTNRKCYFYAVCVWVRQLAALCLGRFLVFFLQLLRD